MGLLNSPPAVSRCCNFVLAAAQCRTVKKKKKKKGLVPLILSYRDKDVISFGQKMSYLCCWNDFAHVLLILRLCNCTVFHHSQHMQNHSQGLDCCDLAARSHLLSVTFAPVLKPESA